MGKKKILVVEDDPDVLKSMLVRRISSCLIWACLRETASS
jgi:hypothetical protein